MTNTADAKPLRSPLVRLAIALAFVVPVLVAQIAVWRLRPFIGALATAALSAAIASLVGWAAYRAYVRRFERREPSELAASGARREVGAGFAIGCALFTATICAIALFGAYRATGFGEPIAVVVALLMAIGAGAIEEIVFRGVVFRLLEEWGGTTVGLAASALLFGGLHCLNPQATLLGVAAIVLLGGIMLAAAYVLTRRLWLPIGIHAGWNFAEGGIFGVPTSGFATKGLLVGELGGPVWLSGGSFGPESSIVAVVVCLAAAAVLLRRAAQRDRFVAARWKRGPPPNGSG